MIYLAIAIGFCIVLGDVAGPAAAITAIILFLIVGAIAWVIDVIYNLARRR